MKSCTRFARAAAGAGTCLAVLATAGAAHASGPYSYAGSDDVGRRLTVCAASLTVYDLRGQLRNPQTFTVKGFDRGYVYGFAWGHVNAHGLVQNGWFCDA